MKFFIWTVILLNAGIVFFFFQLICYGIVSYISYWKKKKDFNTNRIYNLLKTSVTKHNYRNLLLPKICIIIPARDESKVISNTIASFANLTYPKDRYQILIVCDDKELKSKPYDETTQYEVDLLKEYYNKRYKTEFIISTSVPCDFDGEFNGKLTGKDVVSTKPRALNWALKFIPTDVEILGFYDADSNPENETLLYVAYKKITEPNRPVFLQGSVIQVRNFYYIGLLNKIYALYQAATHEWFLPMLLKKLPFIGGTNFFIDKEVVLKAKGFNPETLSEDLEFGCRIYLQQNIWPEFMPYIATEQTPPDYRSYFRQRFRWATGYLQVIENVFNQQTNLFKKLYILSNLLFYGILPWALYQLIIAFTVGLLLVVSGIIHIYFFIPIEMKVFTYLMNGLYLLLTFYLFERWKKHFAFRYLLNSKCKTLLNYLQLCILPVAAILGVLPYTYAATLKILNNRTNHWEKTPRTKESEINYRFEDIN